MLGITRRNDEAVRIIAPNGDEIKVVVRKHLGHIRMMFEGPREYRIVREEVYQFERGATEKIKKLEGWEEK